MITIGTGIIFYAIAMSKGDTEVGEVPIGCMWLMAVIADIITMLSFSLMEA